MIFGSKEDFAIECYLHNVPAMRRDTVIGRLCVWCAGQKLGDVDDINVLNVPENVFRNLLTNLADRQDGEVDSLTDQAAFRLLDMAIYGDDDRSIDQIKLDSRRFGKFNFLTNWGESFDCVKAFLLNTGDGLRVLFQRDSKQIEGVRISETGLRRAVQGFVGWVQEQRRSGDVTEADWIDSDDVEGMIDWLRTNEPASTEVIGRKLRLFNCACCRRIWSLFPNELSRKAIEVAECYADGLASEEALTAARQAGKDIANATIGSYSAEGYAAWAAVYASYETPFASCAYNTRAAIYFANGKDESLSRLETHSQIAVLRDVFSNPFRPVSMPRSCLTPNVVQRAQSIYESRSFERMPELADILEAAGCNNAEILNHCRGTGRHVRGCWVIDLILGKE